ncbi:hypothetical protein OU560_03185, partial [Escherichia coli]|nr:hypothetical protein [Escherichia coli]
AKAYKDERLVRLVAEEPDPEMRNILTALNTAASDFAQMQSLSAKNRREPSPNAGGEERRKSPKGFKKNHSGVDWF